ncbi:MAG: Rpn family recombination-promoting nuclease/putative transposase [Dysgonamonadaceae bacterium]|jgi:predicted transposase/invertase (TIGR01784 family)|nr:Rpn family recombination-promoting nuclease/putative transposase [Dysgonamonadaceae bacterium]
MSENRPNPLNDYLFMKYMGEEGDEEQLLDFLSTVLQKTGRDDIVSVKILDNKHFSAEIKGSKASILDVRAVMNDSTKVNIEVQLQRVGNMDKRSLYYWCREYIKGIRSGKDYIKLPQVVSINILGDEFLPIDEVHTSFHLWEDSHKDFMLTNVMEVHFIEMAKFRRLKKKDIEHNKLHRWLAFMDKDTDENTIKKIIAMEPFIEKAQRKIARVLQDEDMLRIYHNREMAALDYTSGMNNARREGIALGEQRGIEQGIIIGKQRGIALGEQKILTKHVSMLFQEGWSLEKIMDFTGLSAKEVNRILK